MEPTQTTAPQIEQKHALFRVTPLSKYLAMILFILMPFIGGWVGYTYAPEKVVEVERIIIRDDSEVENNTTQQTTPHNASSTQVTAYIAAVTDTSIVLDFMTVLSGDEAVDAMIEDGVIKETARSSRLADIWSVYDRNTNPLLRTFPLAPGAQFHTWYEQEKTKDQFPSTTNEYDFGQPNGYPQQVTINAAGEVVHSVDLFRP